ncbi:MAG: GGDEF domain-containing protein [Lachnospiraceae bacterium]|nr:GGDEF domain-containing protein [Lachnospiraceae bacterium]
MSKKYVFELVGMISLLLIIFTLIVSGLTESDRGEGFVLDSYVSIEVERADGAVEHYDSNYFHTSEKGDRVIVTIPLPAEKKISNAVLFCSVYQCAVELAYQGEVLYSYGNNESERGRAIGNVLVCADVPDEAWGDALTMECEVVDYTDFTKLDSVMVCESKNKTQFLLGDNAAAYLLSMTVLVVFAVIFFVLLCGGQSGEIKMQGLYLSSFCVGLMTWQMGYERMFYVISNNVTFCGLAEYVGIFFAPAPFCMFLCYVEPNKLFQKAMKILAGALITVFGVTTVLNFTTEQYHYCRFLKVVHVLIAIVAVVILLEFILVRCKGDNKRLLIRFGVILYIFFAMSDMLLFYVEKTGGFHIDISVESITSLGLYIFLVVMLISYVLHVLEYVVSVEEKQRLEQMAYLDGMTGIANRRGCLDYFEKLKKKEDYTVFFFDVNNLKIANDQYGHDIGDQLISAVARIIRKVFGEKGFFGRYGGDEFVAVVEHLSADTIKQMEDSLKDAIVRANKEEQLPISITVAYGIASSTEGEGLQADEVVRLADERMYEQKRRMKESFM